MTRVFFEDSTGDRGLVDIAVAGYEAPNIEVPALYGASRGLHEEIKPTLSPAFWHVLKL
ncbi:hypothetical protein ACQU0X_27105 [Pseudovibrio ascidiaceicola]|uniref:hypothetical protein n=1 Tax=Pseudovibrio ascidiaceicola TaxID=285279 RepID=UPI003D3603B5